MLRNARAGIRTTHHRRLSQDQEQAAKDGQCNFHNLVIVQLMSLRQTFFVLQSSFFVRLVGGADDGNELVRVFFKLGFAHGAAQFHFLAFVNEHIRLSHVASEFLTGHRTGRELVGRGFGVFGTRTQTGGQRNSNDDG